MIAETSTNGQPATAIDPLIEPEYVFSDRYPSRSHVYRAIAEASADARAEPSAKLDLAYGEHERERIDLFPGDTGRPLLIFVHGGYWRSQHKNEYGFVANELRRHGISVAVVGYPLAPGRSLERIVGSLHLAMAWLAGPGRRHLPDTGETVVAGHSAGAHLAAMLAGGSVAGREIGGVLALSGIFDLGPLLRTSIGIEVGLDEALACRLSPLRRRPGKGWLITAVGANETAAFHEQTAGYAAHWSATGGAVTSLSIPGADHYSMLLQMAEPASPVLQALLAKLNRVRAHREATP